MLAQRVVFTTMYVLSLDLYLMHTNNRTTTWSTVAGTDDGTQTADAWRRNHPRAA